MNVFPTKTSLTNSYGLLAARFEIDKEEPSSDFVNIFDEGFDVTPCYVNIQMEFYKEWKESRKT